jgi:Tfp pilus assembly protein PilF
VTTSLNRYRTGWLLAAASICGCQSTSGWSLNPLSWSKTKDATASIADGSPQSTVPPSGATGTVGQLATGARGQLGSMGLAVKGAYSKTTNALTGMISPKTTQDGVASDDPLSLANKTKSVSPEVFVANGQLWETTGNLEKAQEQYVKALEAQPNNAAALASIARLMAKQEKHEAAVEYFTKAITAAPNDAGLYNDLGLAYSKLGKHDEAVAQLQKAMAISPSTTRYANNLAVVQMNAGKSDAAMTTLSKAHEPSKAHYNMAWMHYQRQEMDSAREHLDLALKVDPNMDRAKELMSKIGTPRLANVAQNTGQIIQKTEQFANSAQQASQSAQELFRLPASAPVSPATTATIQPSTIQPSTIQPSTIQPSTIQPSTTSPTSLQMPSRGTPMSLPSGSTSTGTLSR